MSANEDAHSLLDMLKQKYGVDESDSMLGPSVIVPNQDLKREWTVLLQANDYHMYVGEQDGRVAWVIPLKPRQGGGHFLKIENQDLSSDFGAPEFKTGAFENKPFPSFSKNETPCPACPVVQTPSDADSSLSKQNSQKQRIFFERSRENELFCQDSGPAKGGLFKCPFCLMFFATEHDLKLHVAALHGGRHCPWD